MEDIKVICASHRHLEDVWIIYKPPGHPWRSRVIHVVLCVSWMFLLFPFKQLMVMLSGAGRNQPAGAAFPITLELLAFS